MKRPKSSLFLAALPLLGAAADQQTASQSQPPPQKRQVRRYPKWLQPVVQLSHQYAHFDEAKGVAVEQKFRNMATILELHKIDDYMSQIIHTDPFFEPVRDKCLLKYEWCAEMASLGLCPPDNMGIGDYNAIGQCPDGPATFMENNCAPACRMCHLLSYETRCPVDQEETKKENVFQKPGDINRMFERILNNEALERDFGPVIARSRPGGDPNNSSIINGPYIITIDNFLTEDECAVLRYHGSNTGEGFSRSNTGDGKYRSSSRDIRTSSTNWCRDGCHEDPIVQYVHRRIELLTGIPQENFEYLQILQYNEGEYYRVHHDYNAKELERPQGVRLLTVFLYLSNVEEGGGTYFNELNSVDNNLGTQSIPGTGGEVTIRPKLGRAVIWSSVLDANPEQPDRRARHGAEVVIKGTKYGANAWIHSRNYKLPYSKTCHDEQVISINV